ncbi:MAG: hypothetical protein IPL83_16340 [Bdellovibrionales bacterium]|nr:hypothetical protein [Bdellovibrionales bacterium]
MKFISKSIFLARFLALASLSFSPVPSIAQSNPGLPPGDYVYNPTTRFLCSFGGDPNRKRTGFVEDGISGRSAGQSDSRLGNLGQDYENSPGLSKNARQIEQMGRFIKTKIVGKDDRCPLDTGRMQQIQIGQCNRRARFSMTRTRALKLKSAEC